MKKNPYRWLAWSLLAMVLVAPGCNDGDDDDDAVPDANAPVTMAAGKAATVSGALSSIDAGKTPAAGRVVAMATWEGGGNFTLYMKGGTPANLAWVQGQSPLTGTANNVAQDVPITLYLLNGTPNDVEVTYTVVHDVP